MNSKRFFSFLVSVLFIAMSVGVVVPVNASEEASGTTVVLQVNNTAAIVNGESITLDVAPYIDETSNRTLVPLRFISESLGYTVIWDGEEKAVRIFNKIDMNTIDDSTDESVEYFRSWSTYKYIKLAIGSDIAQTCDEYLIGEHVEIAEESIEQAPVIKDGRTMLPIRFVAEQMNLDVQWDGETKKITISSTEKEYIPLAIETSLKKIVVPYSESVVKIEDDPTYIKSQLPANYFMKISGDSLDYSIDLAVQSSESSETVLSGRVIGFKNDTACFEYELTNQEDYRYDGTIQVKDDSFIINYTNEKGEKCSVTFPNK